MAANDDQSRGPGHAHLDGGDKGEGRAGDGHRRSVQNIPYKIRVGEKLMIDQDNHNNSP